MQDSVWETDCLSKAREIRTRSRPGQWELVKARPPKLLVRFAPFRWGNRTNGSSSKSHTRRPHLTNRRCSLLAIVGTARSSRAPRKCYVPGRPSPPMARDAKYKNLRQALCPRPRVSRNADEETNVARLCPRSDGEGHPEESGQRAFTSSPRRRGRTRRKPTPRARCLAPDGEGPRRIRRSSRDSGRDTDGNVRDSLSAQKGPRPSGK